MRGNLPRPHQPGSGRRYIPAYAGEPWWRWCCRRRRTVYPRVCGGTPAHHPLRRPTCGLSPRMRGNRYRGFCKSVTCGSIPAYAGEPVQRAAGQQNEEVYPRVCGGTRYIAAAQAGRRGLSPRMRGNRGRDYVLEAALGSIPAYAGEPLPGPPPAPRRQVYPRVCGGTRANPSLSRFKSGLSPRMRGNPVFALFPPCLTGSIPAYAGEPWRI